MSGSNDALAHTCSDWPHRTAGAVTSRCAALLLAAVAGAGCSGQVRSNEPFSVAHSAEGVNVFQDVEIDSATKTVTKVFVPGGFGTCTKPVTDAELDDLRDALDAVDFARASGVHACKGCMVERYDSLDVEIGARSYSISWEPGSDVAGEVVTLTTQVDDLASRKTKDCGF